MNRRDFLGQAAAGAAALSFPALARPESAPRMGIVVHSYWARWQASAPSTNAPRARADSQAYPPFRNALDLLAHCHQLGAGGVQVGVDTWTDDFAKQVRHQREQWGLYLEGSIGLPKKADDTTSFEQQVIRAKEAGARVLRTVCSGGRRYEVYHSLADFQMFHAKAVSTLQAVEPILRKHQVKLAIENHKDWRADELAAILRQLASEWIGVTLDFGNNIALLDDPMEVVKTLAPFVLSTHIKDMAVDEYADGFRLSEVPLGQGILDLPAMVALCRQYNPAVTFSLEMITRDPLLIPCLTADYWATFANLPGQHLARTLRLVSQHKSANALPTMVGLSLDQRLAAEDKNIRLCLDYGRQKLGL